MMQKIHNAEECYFLLQKDDFKKEILDEVKNMNETQSKEIDKKIDELKEHLDNGWKKDLIDKLTDALLGIKKTKWQIISEIVKWAVGSAASGGLIYYILTRR
ncbi:hypothetical protein [Kosmotoga pacifica]|nr:hypothetical protein [Kosmotoga pacifica]